MRNGRYQAIVTINVMAEPEPDYRKRLQPVLAASLDTARLLVFTWSNGDPGRCTYTAISEILNADGEGYRARYLYRNTGGSTAVSEEQITGTIYRRALPLPYFRPGPQAAGSRSSP
jgi:hypothetical protein